MACLGSGRKSPVRAFIARCLAPSGLHLPARGANGAVAAGLSSRWRLACGNLSAVAVPVRGVAGHVGGGVRFRFFGVNANDYAVTVVT